MKAKFWLMGTAVILALFAIAHLTYLRLHHKMENNARHIQELEKTLVEKQVEVDSMQKQLDLVTLLAEQDRARVMDTEKKLLEIRSSTTKRLNSIVDDIKVVEEVHNRPAEAAEIVGKSLNNSFLSINEASSDIYPRAK